MPLPPSVPRDANGDVAFHLTGQALWDRMNRAVEKIQQRLERTVATLTAAGIPFAIIGGNAVRAWVAQADEAAVRTTRDVDILINRGDLPAAIEAMEAAGFTHRRVKGIDMFLDNPDWLDGRRPKARDAVHVLFADEPVRPDDLVASPKVTEVTDIDGQPAVNLDALVKMKLNAFRRKDQMHLIDMIDVGLIDESWVDRLPPAFSDRLRELFDNPE